MSPARSNVTPSQSSVPAPPKYPARVACGTLAAEAAKKARQIRRAIGILRQPLYHSKNASSEVGPKAATLLPMRVAATMALLAATGWRNSRYLIQRRGEAPSGFPEEARSGRGD